MLVQFKFNNFKCFKDETLLNLVASNYFKEESDNLISTPFYSVVKTLAVYGANASGKTKLFLAFDFMRDVILHSANNVNSNIWQQKYDPFRLNIQSREASSSFETVFIIDGIQYRYGFELDKTQIHTEWLFRKKTKEINVFYRDEEGIEYNSVYVNKKIAETLKDAKMVRDNALFLSALSVWNDTTASLISNWFYESNILSTSIDNYMGFSLNRLDSPMKSNILSLMQEADIGIEDIRANEVPIENVPDEVKRLLPKEAIFGKIYNGVKTLHKVYDENHLPVGREEFTLEVDESYGTVKFFALSAPIIDTLQKGKRLFVDEIDHGLHFDLLVALIRLFNSPKTNPYNAQLIINTHNVGLLDEGIFRRDQIYITSKNSYGEAILKSITDFSKLKLRKDSKIGDLYREGKLGGVPYLAEFGLSLESK